MNVQVAPRLERRARATESITQVCGAAFVIYGVFLRVWLYLQNYSLNHDEAALALNLMHRTSSQLMRPLDYLQAAPFGFLLVEHAMIRIGGAGERMLRLFPLLCGIAALALFWVFVRRRVGGWASVVAIGFFAASQNLATMDPRVKQYSTEVLATVLLLFACEWLLDEHPAAWKLWASALVGAILPWFAFSSVFMAAGIGTTFALVVMRRRERWKRYALVLAAWAVSIAALLVAVKQLGGAREGLILFWSANFMPVTQPARILPWFWNALLSLGASIMSVRLAPLAVIALLAGIVLAFRRCEWFLVAVIASMGWTLVASALRQYPFTNRFLFFLVPAALVLIAQALSDLPANVSRKAVFPIAAIVVAYACVSAAKNLLISPFTLLQDDPRSVLVEVKQQWQPGDKLYLSSGATPPFLYYQSRLGFRDHDFVTGRAPSSFTWGSVFTSFPDARRVWFMYLPSLDGPFDQQAIQRAGKTGHDLTFIDRGFYAAKLVEISTP